MLCHSPSPAENASCCGLSQDRILAATNPGSRATTASRCLVKSEADVNSQRGTNSIRGIASMILAGVFLTGNDAITKWLVPFYPAGQILFVQGCLICLLVFTGLKVRGERVIVVSNWRGHIYRGLLYVVGSFAFVHALRYLTLAEVVCIAFAGPLFLTLLGRFVLKEHVGTHRVAAVVIGFIGVVVMMRPGAQPFHWALLLPLVVALSDAFRDIVTRQLTATDSSFQIVFTTAFMLAGCSLATVSGDWSALNIEHAALFLVSSCSFVAAHFFLVEAYRHAQTVVVAPFRYIQIIWGIAIGLLVWGEVPHNFLYAGIALTVSAGIYIGWREALAHRARLTR